MNCKQIRPGIWIRVAVSIFYGGIHYKTIASEIIILVILIFTASSILLDLCFSLPFTNNNTKYVQNQIIHLNNMTIIRFNELTNEKLCCSNLVFRIKNCYFVILFTLWRTRPRVSLINWYKSCFFIFKPKKPGFYSRTLYNKNRYY